MTRRLALACALVLCAVCAPPAVSQTQETEVRLWADASRTRLVLESSAPLEYAEGELADPQRLFIDIASPLPPQRINSLAPAAAEAASAYLRGIRAARHSAATLRVVFDLAEGINYRIERLRPIGNYRYRLVVDVAPQDPPDPLADLLAQLAAVSAPDAAAAIGKPFVVLIDPGHGGEDPGAVSPNNRYEKHIVLRISRRLAEAINRRPGMKALLTREEDKFIPLFERVRIAHRLNADAFVSIHADSVKRRSARGSSVFVLSQKGASSKFARRLAKQANLGDMMGGHAPHAANPQDETALRRISQDGKDRASHQLAALMLANLGEINTLHSKRVESAGFAVLKSPRIPSVLVETAFISNPTEEKKLLDAHFQQQLAEALADALETYRRRHHLTQ